MRLLVVDGFLSKRLAAVFASGAAGSARRFQHVSIALITQLSPKEKVGSVVGTLQSVQILSAAFGPFVGGLLADIIGIRGTFFVTGIIAAGSFLSIAALYKDTDETIVRTQPETKVGREFLKRPEFLTTLLILLFVNMADRTFGPIIPLFLEQLGTPKSRLAAVAGTLISIAAFGEAFSSWLSGKLASRVTLRKLILWRLALSILVLLPMLMVHSTEQFSLLRVALALLAGGTLTLALTAASHVIPPEHRGSGYSILSGTSMLGGATGPLIAGPGGFEPSFHLRLQHRCVCADDWIRLSQRAALIPT